jgi:hypothetical protein
MEEIEPILDCHNFLTDRVINQFKPRNTQKPRNFLVFSVYSVISVVI